MRPNAGIAAILLFTLLVFTFPVLAGEAPVKGIPDAVAGWKRSAPTEVRPAGVFDYMDGAGELYLAYNFVRLEVYHFTAEGRGSILVEIYHMPSSDDAWGLLSGDWGGEEIALSGGRRPAAQTYGGRVPAARALYGAGLLRVAAGNLYVRVMAERETEESRRAVLELGRAIVGDNPLPGPPDIVSMLPAGLSDLQLMPERVLFFRTHLVLNSVYYLSSSNILELDNRCAAVTAAYKQQAGKANALLLIIRYPSAAAAGQAFKSFTGSYLPEVKQEPGATKCTNQVEDGWVSVSRHEPYLALAFRASSRDAAEALVGGALAGVKSVEGSKQ